MLLIATSPCPSDSVQGVTFSHDGKVLAVAQGESYLLLEVPSLHVSRELPAQAEGVFAVAFSPDGRTLLSGGDDQTIQYWDVASGELKGVHQGHAGRIWNLAVSPDGRTIASAGGDGTIKLWDPAPPRDHDTITIDRPLAALRFSRDGKRLAALDRDGGFSVRESDTGRLVLARPLLPLAGPQSAGRRSIISGAISGDARTVLITDDEGTFAILDAERGRVLATAGDRGFPDTSLGISSDGSRAFLVRTGRQAESWDPSAARRVGILKGDFGFAAVLDGNRLLLDDPGPSPAIWETTRGGVMRPSSAIHFFRKCLGLSPDGRRVAFYDGLVNWLERPDHRVRLIDTDLLVELPSPIVSPVAVTAVAFDPTGRTLAAGCEDHRIRLWDVSSGETLLTLEGHSGPVSLVHFSPDGETLATGTVRPDGTTEIFLWRASRR